MGRNTEHQAVLHQPLPWFPICVLTNLCLACLSSGTSLCFTRSYAAKDTKVMEYRMRHSCKCVLKVRKVEKAPLNVHISLPVSAEGLWLDKTSRPPLTSLCSERWKPCIHFLQARKLTSTASCAVLKCSPLAFIFLWGCQQYEVCSSVSRTHVTFSFDSRDGR